MTKRMLYRGFSHRGGGESTQLRRFKHRTRGPLPAEEVLQVRLPEKKARLLGPYQTYKELLSAQRLCTIALGNDTLSILRQLLGLRQEF